MKIRSELQRYLSENRYKAVFLLLIALAVSVLSAELSAIFILAFGIFILFRRRAAGQVPESGIHVVDRKRISSDTDIYLIEYSGRRYLIFSGKNSALKIGEERSDV